MCYQSSNCAELLLLLTALNSTTKPRCRGCTTGYYCPGDGTEKRCGVASPTEFSFGAAANCSACPEGWVSKMRLCYGRSEWGRRMFLVRYKQGEVTLLYESKPLQLVVFVVKEKWVGRVSVLLLLQDCLEVKSST